MRICLAACMAFLSLVAAAAPYKVGVFDVALTDGRGASSAGFIKVFAQLHDYQAEALDSLELGALFQYDVLILYDMHTPGNVAGNWRENLERYLRAGGSVLNIYHQHIFSTIGPGVLKVYVPEVQPTGDSPITEGISRFKTDWPDHIILKPGKDATVFLENTEGQPVAACGQIGKGKVIDCGLALGIRADWRTSKPPAGVERTLLENILRWLEPAERWPVRLSAYAVKPELTAWVKSGFVRQPQAIILSVRGLVPQAADSVSVEVALVDADGKRAQAKETIEAAELPGTKTGKVSAEVTTGTEGLASGLAKVSYTIKAAGDETAGETEVRLVRATPPDKEFRAFWTHAFEDRLPADIMPKIKACGFNAVIPRSSGGTGAFYLSKVLPDIRNILGEEDWLANCIEHAHKSGLQVHPYRNCFIMEGRASKETIAKFRADGRLQVSPEGRPLDWMCPSQEINRQVELAAASEFVRDYDVDGFQFDFIRYPGPQGCFCPKCREKFERERGARVENWPQDVVKDGKLFEEYTKFRQTQITETVKMVSEAIRKINPEVKISAAVFRDYAANSVSVGQDWVTWAKEGYVDFLCPMDYTNDVAALDGWVRDQIARVGEYVPVCAGLGLAASSARMKTPEDMALQIDIARQAGCAGFVLFAWHPGCDEKIVLPQREDSLAGTPPIP